MLFGSVPSTFHALSVHADGGLALFSDLTTFPSGLHMDGDADRVAVARRSGVDSMQVGAGVRLASEGVLQLKALTGGLQALGALTLAAATGVLLHDSLHSVGVGELALHADSTAAGDTAPWVNGMHAWANVCFHALWLRCLLCPPLSAPEPHQP